MRNTTLAIAGIAACTIGVLGGMAANPTMKPASMPDWRERYRALASAMTWPAEPVHHALPESAYGYDLAAARAYTRMDRLPVPALEVAAASPPIEPPLPDPDWTVEAERAHPGGAGNDGAAAVAAALNLTAGIGDAAIGPEPVSVPAPPYAVPPPAINGVGKRGAGD